MTKQTSVTSFDSANARALVALMSQSIRLTREAAPSIEVPLPPESYGDVTRGLERIVAEFIDEGRSGERKTSADDVERSFIEVLSKAQTAGFDFNELGGFLSYRRERDIARSNMDYHIRVTDAKADETAHSICKWLGDIVAVLGIRKVVGADVVREAAEAPNKSLASVALDMFLREAGTKGATAGLSPVAAGRGLMALAQVGVCPAELSMQDVVMAAGIAMHSAYPEPLAGSPNAAVDMRLGAELVRVVTQGATLYETATTEAAGNAMLPRRALVAVSEAALNEMQNRIDGELAIVGHQFPDGQSGGRTLDEARRSWIGSGRDAIVTQTDSGRIFTTSATDGRI